MNKCVFEKGLFSAIISFASDAKLSIFSSCLSKDADIISDFMGAKIRIMEGKSTKLHYKSCSFLKNCPFLQTDLFKNCFERNSLSNKTIKKEMFLLFRIIENRKNHRGSSS